MTVHQLRHPRSLAHVLIDIADQRDLDRRLKQLGCPYENADPRSSYWLEGYCHAVRQGQ